MEKSFKIHGIKYWILLLLIILFTRLYINNDESILNILLFFPTNIFHITITFAIILTSLLFYIETILNYVNLETMILVRLRKHFKFFIIKRIVFSFLAILLLLLIFLMICIPSITNVLLLLFSLSIQLFVFLSFVFILRKRAFQYVLIGNFILNVALRIILTLCL